MSERTSLTGNGSWTNIGTGPASVQLIAPGSAEVMLVCSATEPTGSDGIVLSSFYPLHEFTLSDTIWAQVIQSGVTVEVAVQQEVAP